jgi:hypothetical protein
LNRCLWWLRRWRNHLEEKNGNTIGFGRIGFLGAIIIIIIVVVDIIIVRTITDRLDMNHRIKRRKRSKTRGNGSGRNGMG